MEYARSMKCLGIVGALAFAPACASPVEDGSDPAPPPAPAAIVPLNAAGTEVPNELFDTKGRRWVFKRQFPAFATGRPTLDTSGSGTYVADSLSDDDLAEALRPARLRGNVEYILDTPHADLLATLKSSRAMAKAGGYRHPGPFDVARTVGASGEAQIAASTNVALSSNVFGAALGSSVAGDLPRNRSFQGASLIAPSEEPFAYGLEERRENTFFALSDSASLGLDSPASPRWVLGTDDRYHVTHAGVAAWPHTSTVVIGEWVSGAGVLNGSQCSANLVGYYTALTAAHCFWEPYAQYPYPHRPIANGVVTSGTRGTYTPWLISSQTRIGNATECYDEYYPTGWTTYFSWDFDYGVIEFGCSVPGSNGNWIGVGWNESAYATESAWLEAYDNLLDPLDANSSNDYGPYADPTLRTRFETGPNAVKMYEFNSRLLVTTRIDASPAASGGCVRQQLWRSIVPYDWHCSGVVSHGNPGGTSNFFRRMDSDYWAFLQSFSEF